MGLILSTAASLMLVSGGTYGIDLLMERYATPEARIEAKSTTRATTDEQRKRIAKTGCNDAT